MLRTIFLTGLMMCAAALDCPAEFRAAAAKADITPKNSQWLMGYSARRSTGVHDKIFHHVVAMDDGSTQMYIVSSDLCLFSPGVYDEAAQDLKREAGIDRRQFWWSVTHSHAAPEVGAPGMYKALLGRSDHEWDREYASLVRKSLVAAVLEARSKLTPARLAIGTGMAMANINRRARNPNGAISLGLNPYGPVDRQIGLIRLERPDGSPIALIANYAMHGTVMSGENLEVSGDGPGVAAAYVEEKIGAPVLYINGAAGNIAPIYSVYPDARKGHLTEFCVLLGDRILEANAALGPAVSQVKLWAGEKIVETKAKDGLSWPEDLPAYARTNGAGTLLVRVPVRFLRINGDAVLWAAPVEMFCEISGRVRSESPFPYTFYFGYTNGWMGYMPTAKAFEEGGYEPKTSPFTGAAERDIGEGVITFLKSMPR